MLDRTAQYTNTDDETLFALIEQGACITGEVRMIRQSMYDGRITTTRTQHNLSNPVRLEQMCIRDRGEPL